MAASMKAAGMVLARASSFSEATLFVKSRFMPRALPQLQFVRERRRTTKPAAWHVTKKVSPFWHRRELTPENRDFLQTVYEEGYEGNLSPLRDEPWPRAEWTKRTLRTGVLAVKLGTQPQWTKDGQRILTTVLQVLDNHAIRYVSPEEYSKYVSCKPQWRRLGLGIQVVGALSTDPFKYTKAYCNLFQEAGVPPKRKLTRFLVTPDTAVEPGTPLYANHFRVGDYVDCQAKTVGHGFQGVVKRWGFKGGPKSHGTTKWHRRPGAMGGGGDKAAVWKGKKLPGHMGMEWRTCKGLKIWRMNTKYNLLYVMGRGVPGPVHCYVRVMDSRLVHHRLAFMDNPPHLPTWYPDDAPDDMPEELFDEQLFQFASPSVTFEETKS